MRPSAPYSRGFKGFFKPIKEIYFFKISLWPNSLNDLPASVISVLKRNQIAHLEKGIIVNEYLRESDFKSNSSTYSTWTAHCGRRSVIEGIEREGKA